MDIRVGNEEDIDSLEELYNKQIAQKRGLK